MIDFRDVDNLNQVAELFALSVENKELRDEVEGKEIHPHGMLVSGHSKGRIKLPILAEVRFSTGVPKHSGADGRLR
jgi:hypothetical protein